MPLAEYKGGLIVKVEIDENGNEVQKLCTTCCGDDDPYGCCCYLDSEGNWQKEQLRASDCAKMPDSSHSPDTDCDDVECPPTEPTYCCVYQYGNGGSVQADTAEEAIQAAYQGAIDTVNNLYPGQADPTWGYQKSDGTWTQEAGFNSTNGKYFQNPVWIWNTSSPLYEAPECLPSSNEKCTAPFAFPKDGDCSTDCPDITPPPLTGCCCRLKQDGSTDKVITTTSEECSAYISPGVTDVVAVKFNPGKNCDDPDVECPEFPTQPSGICLYRDDGLGTCWGYEITGDELPQLFATEEEAQAYIDAGGCPDNDPSAPDCAVCRCFPAELGVDEAPESKWGIIQECVVYTEEYDEFGNETGNYICEKTIYLSNCTEDQCDAQGEANPLADIEWRNDKPANKCKPVASEDECTESTGTFCPNVTECPEDFSAGCPETPGRSNPLP